MPFERYLAPSLGYAENTQDPSEVGSPTFSTNVHFQLPHLMHAAPTLAPGGGAEVLPPAFLSSSSAAASSWLSNSAYYANSDDFSSPALKQHHVAQHITQPTYPSSTYLRTYPRSTDLSQSPTQPHYSYLHPPSPSTVQSYPAPMSPLAAVSIPNFPASMPLPSALGLPVYSASGFDLLSILSRVISRPNQKILLGPVDMTCSFVVVDTRRYDAPIVYASPTFCNLTGYDEHEVIGRNCRFLQSPDGRLQRGEQRFYTAPEAVSYLKRSLVADKECQTSMINYRKGGAAFINLVTVIPLPGGVNNTPAEADDVAYHVGFQVDLSQQPSAILQRLRDGSYIVDYSRKLSTTQSITAAQSTRDWRVNATTMSGASNDLRTLLAEPAFVNSIPLSMPAVAPVPSTTGERADPYDGNKPLHLFLLESTPDFVHVMSLKGAFLYVAPAVRRVLGYDPEELVGKSIAEFCHPADVVPLMRELKESSVTSVSPGLGQYSAAAAGDGALSDTQVSYGQPGRPRTVDLLFRMQAKAGNYLWIECRGRLHVEPGKGRKAIILSGRVRHLPRLDWGIIERAGGLEPPTPTLPSGARRSPTGSEDEHGEMEREFWGLLSGNGAFLFVGTAVRDVLGWGAGEIIGRTIGDLVGGHATVEARLAVAAGMARVLSASAPDETCQLSCEMTRKDGVVVVVSIVFYPSQDDGAVSTTCSPSSSSRPVVCQVKLAQPSGSPTSHIVHPLGESIFSELDISRGSSWQYELQQLKFANQRLLEEVSALEASVGSQVESKDQVPRQTPTHAQDRARSLFSQQSDLLYHEEQPDVRYTIHPDVADRAQDWNVPYYQEAPQGSLSLMNSLPLKRSWTAYASDGSSV